MQSGIEFKDALKAAQDKGIAEPDPSLDIEGWDTAYKLLLITNSVFHQKFVLSDVEVIGIVHASRVVEKESVDHRKKIKLLGKVIRQGDCFRLSVNQHGLTFLILFFMWMVQKRAYLS